MSYTATSGSPFVWSYPTGTSSTAQVDVFSAAWVRTSNRTFEGKALVDGSIGLNSAGLGRTTISPVSPLTSNQSYDGGTWGIGGAAKVVSDDRMVTFASSLTWSWAYQAGSIVVYPSKSRILAMRVSV